MPLFMVSYDLIAGKDYRRLETRLANWNATRVLLSQWVIQWDSSSPAIRDDLLQYIDTDDRLLVVRLTGQAAWRRLLVSNEAAIALFEGASR
jgi:hypothetical protein